MGEGAQRFHDIPLSRREVVDALLEDLDALGESTDTRAAFSELSRLLGAIFHYELHEQLEELKAAYAPINPDRDQVRLEGEPPESVALSDRVEKGLSAVLEHGNYRRLSERDLERALQHKSLFPVLVSIDFEVLDDYVVYVRGESMRDTEVKTWLGLRRRMMTVPTFDRLCLYLRFKPEHQLEAKKKKKLSYEPGMTLLKLFRNIPKADIDMLFPNTEVKMRLIDKLLIGVPAVVGGVPVLLKLTPVMIAVAVMLGFQHGEVNWAGLVAGLSGLVGLGIFLFRQWDKFRSRKILFMRMLSENLYFLNIDNNEGVLTRLIDEAEEEEHKEALLAYHFLRLEPELDAEAVDRRVERWLDERFGVEVDFEIDDALGKLVRFGLAKEHQGSYQVEAVGDACALLTRRWSRYFAAGGGDAPIDSE